MRSSDRVCASSHRTLSVAQQSTGFLFLLVIPVIAGCALAIWQSDAVTRLWHWPGGRLDAVPPGRGQQRRIPPSLRDTRR